MTIMTVIQEQAIQLVQQLSDGKIQAIITLAKDDVKLMRLSETERAEKRKLHLLLLKI